MTARQLLEALSSGSSGPPSVDLDLDDLRNDFGPAAEAGDLQDSGLSPDKTEVSILHDVRPGKAPQPVVEALSSMSSELLGVSVWDVVSKKNRLKVTGCLRWTGSSYEALGLVLYRVQHQILQLVYLGVAHGERRHQVGRSLVKALREAARRDPLCLSILALLPAEQQTEE
ncbi:unnamed protein product, partial [Polarella glacialis]